MNTVVTCKCGWTLNVGPNVQQRFPCARCFELLVVDTKSAATSGGHLPQGPRHPLSRLDWDALHQYAIDESLTWDPLQAEHWYRSWLPANGFPLVEQGDEGQAIAWASPDYSSANAFFVWSVALHNQAKRLMGRRLLSVSEASLRYRFPRDRGSIQRLVTWDDLTRDTMLLSQQILDEYPDVSGIAGCPRSGMRAATDIALRLDLPLYEASAEHGLRRCSAGGRLYKSDIHGVRQDPASNLIVIVDDSACSGTAARELRSHPTLRDLPIFVVYVANAAKKYINGFAVNLALPHWFEWNFFNNGQLLSNYNVGIDWDGVLNEDCPPEDDDDGPRYRFWMESLKPIRLPRAFQVPFIVTGRCEHYRRACEDWLSRNSINYGKLIMFPGTFADRKQTNVGWWKAQVCMQHGIGLFVESSMLQAEYIAGAAPIIVLCTEKT